MVGPESQGRLIGDQVHTTGKTDEARLYPNHDEALRLTARSLKSRPFVKYTCVSRERDEELRGTR